MSLAAKFRGVATKLLTKFDERTSGGDAIQLKRTPVEFNPNSGENEFGTPVITDLVGVSVKFDREYTNSANSAGNAIQAGDQLLKITATTEIEMGDKILLDGLEYSIESISPSRYTNQTILQSVHVRR